MSKSGGPASFWARGLRGSVDLDVVKRRVRKVSKSGRPALFWARGLEQSEDFRRARGVRSYQIFLSVPPDGAAKRFRDD